MKEGHKLSIPKKEFQVTHMNRCSIMGNQTDANLNTRQMPFPTHQAKISLKVPSIGNNVQQRKLTTCCSYHVTSILESNLASFINPKI